MKTCPNCNEEGESECETCGGNGNCPTCECAGGCQDCGGNGEITCEECDGKGEVEE